MNEIFGIILGAAIYVFGLSVIILVAADIFRDKLEIKRRKKEDWRKKLIPKKGIAKLVEVFSKPIPGRSDNKSVAEAAIDAGISAKELAQALTTLGGASRLTEESMRSFKESLTHANIDISDLQEARQRDALPNLDAAGIRGAIAGENLRAMLGRTENLRSELRTELRQIQRRTEPNQRGRSEDWLYDNVLFSGQKIKDLSEVAIQDALNRIRFPSPTSSSFEFSTILKSEKSVESGENETKTKVVKLIRIRQRRKIR